MTGDHSGLRSEGVEQAHYVAHETEEHVRLDSGGAASLAVIAHVGRHRVEAGLGERRQLVPPAASRSWLVIYWPRLHATRRRASFASLKGRGSRASASIASAPNAQAERRAERVRSRLLFGGILVSPPSWQQFERSRETGTDTDGGEIATVRRQHPVDMPSLSYSDDGTVDESQVERCESRIEFEGTNDVGG